MKKEKKTAACKDSKTKKSIDLEKLMEADFQSKFPVCREVKSFLEVIEPYLDDNQLGILADGFLGFSAGTQREMLKCILLNIAYGDIKQTGVTHIDLLLCDMRDLIYEAIILPDMPFSRTICVYSAALLKVFSLMEERRNEWEEFNDEYNKLLAETHMK